MQMKKWFHEFIIEVDAIDIFFVDKVKEYVTKFVGMHNKFLQKLENDKIADSESGISIISSSNISDKLMASG